ncbi:hypothetical protein ACI6PS_11970 [Flavobacterium sp. PLA-1-15]|uniref:hypothetical protein n=1 Tax=Flavobacterium sp. PLA-1-15 TaxID=3380533 RepID=UPI003B781326
MKTSEKRRFPKLENEYLENIVRQLVSQYTIIQMFFTKQSSCKHSCLLIHVEKNSDAQLLRQAKWANKVRDRYKIHVCFIYAQKLDHKFSLGHPFVALYCQPSALIYQKEGYEHPIALAGSWKKFKKKFDVFQDHFHHDRDLHVAQIKNLISEGSSNSVFASYARLIEYDLDYLEELYLGNKSALPGLEERINNLVAYLPDIQKYFVRTNRNTFYLTDLFAKAKEATADDDTIYKEEMYKAVGIAEQSLCRLIEERFDGLRKMIKKGFEANKEVAGQIDEKPKDVILGLAIATILESVEVEQIYLYHQITYGEKTTYYLMLIATGTGNEKLKTITQSLKSKTGSKCDFVLIAHSRYWIQANLYQHQSFFSGIIQDKYLIYASSDYLPGFHWEVPHNPYHADLYFYYKPTKDIALQFFTIAHIAKENYQGLDYFFALFFMSFCRTYIFSRTYYMPNYLSNQTLWQLCAYADSDIQKYDYLIGQFWTDFFPYLDRHTTLHHKLSKLNREEVCQMNVIVEKLMGELHNLVVEKGLLPGSEED